jgi:hypothetical protein
MVPGQAESIEELPAGFELGLVPSVAPLGEGLVIVEDSDHGSGAVVQNADGTYKALPDAPEIRNHSLVPAEEGVVLVGVDCVDEKCYEAELASFRLTSEGGEWERVETSDVEVFDSSVVEHVGGAAGSSAVRVGNQVLLVGDHSVDLLPFEKPEGIAFLETCATSDGSVVYGLSNQRGGTENPPEDPIIQSGPLEYDVLAVQSLSPDDPRHVDAVEPPPLSSPPSSMSILCSDSELLVLADGVEFSFDGEEWRRADAAGLSALGDERLIQNRATVLSDGTVVAVTIDGGIVWTRAPDGAWSARDVAGARAAVGEGDSGQAVLTDERNNTLRSVAAG